MQNLSYSAARFSLPHWARYSGLMLIAHTKAMAAAFSKLIAAQRIEKHYLVRVKGQLADTLLQQGELAIPLDDKACLTQFTLRRFDAETAQSWLDIKLISGRKHQIRRHFAAVGHPVMGDPQYGQHNKDSGGLALQAVSLAFNCPGTGKPMQFTLPSELQLLR